MHPRTRRCAACALVVACAVLLPLQTVLAQSLPLPPPSRPNDQLRPLEPLVAPAAIERPGTTRFECPAKLPVLYVERGSSEPRDVALVTPEAPFFRAWVKPDRPGAWVYCAYGIAPAVEGDLEGRLLALRHRFGNELVGRCTVTGPQVACETRGSFRSLVIEPTAFGGR